MLQRVTVGRWSLDSYRGIAPQETLEALREQALALRGAHILHVNATPYGGGVSELLRSSVPLLRDLGLDVDWKVMPGSQEFFHATKALHNGLQGSPRPLTPAEEAAYLDCSREHAATLDGAYDFIVIHDPQPAALLSIYGKGGARWVWRCHIDTSEPNHEVWSFLRPLLSDFDAAVFTMPEFAPPDLPIERVETIAPAIDPLSPKNIELDPATASQILDWIGIDLPGRLITQVSRFDLWKDPLGVIAAYRLVREEVPELQLALVGSMALDDPEGWDVYREVSESSEGDPLIHVYTNLTGVGSVEVNAFQRLSDVVVQKSTREGFGLVVSESLWKGTPVVAGRAGGIPLQMPEGVGGLLVESVEECAEGILGLLRDPERAAELGRSGRERVRERFLLPRLLLEELRLLSTLDG
ncbi:MAG TPA: glycosyltransferase [Solirubrobacteraceae bacterium]|jgi:trehalose synthase|nr:glycosyltransferase [Solirubrobacteraceae bacterium]